VLKLLDCIYLHSATVTLLSFLHKPVATDCRSHNVLVIGFVQQAAGTAVYQVPLIVVAAAATECARNIPAEEKTTHFPH